MSFNSKLILTSYDVTLYDVTTYDATVEAKLLEIVHCTDPEG